MSDFKLTPAREKELEKLAKDLPDAEFKKRYGKDWKSVKIATAMNMLKKKYGFKEMKSFKEFQEGAGLWANIHKKRKEGRPMRKPGSKGAPTKQDFERSRSEGTDEALVAKHGDILNSIWSKLKPELEKDLEKGNVERVNNIGRLVKLQVTKKGQNKMRAFSYKLK